MAPRYSGGVEIVSTEPAVAVQVQADALEEMVQIEDTVAAPFEYFQFIVQPFDKATTVSIDEVVGDLFPPTAERV